MSILDVREGSDQLGAVDIKGLTFPTVGRFSKILCVQTTFQTQRQTQCRSLGVVYSADTTRMPKDR